MNATHQRYVAVLFLVLGFLLTINLFAQTETVTVRGQVTDPSTALIPGAIVRFKAGDAKEFSAVTGASGGYELKNLPPATYTVMVTAPGFESFEQTDVVIAAGRSTQHDFALSIAVEKQDVTVNEQSNGIDTSSENNASQIVIKGAALDALR